MLDMESAWQMSIQCTGPPVQQLHQFLAHEGYLKPRRQQPSYYDENTAQVGSTVSLCCMPCCRLLSPERTCRQWLPGSRTMAWFPQAPLGTSRARHTSCSWCACAAVASDALVLLQHSLIDDRSPEAQAGLCSVAHTPPAS